MLDIRDFGCDATGNSPCGAAFQNVVNLALSGINNPSGNAYQGIDGTIFVPTGIFWVDQQITIPFDQIHLTQRALRIVGASVGFAAGGPGAGGGTNLYGQSVLRMTAGSRSISSATISGTTITISSPAKFTSADVGAYISGVSTASNTLIPSNTVIIAVSDALHATLSGAPGDGTYDTVTVNQPKILTIGAKGQLMIEHLLLTGGGIGSLDTAPFIQSIGTVLKLNDVGFSGTGNPRNVIDAMVTSGSKVLTSNTAAFTQQDVGAPIYVTTPPPMGGAGTPVVPAGTYIASVQSSTQCTVSQAASPGSNSPPYYAWILSSFQDAIILGGTEQPTPPSPSNDKFSGYGSVIDKCFFDYIRRAVYYRAAANSVTFRDNEINNHCSGGPNEGAVDLDGFAEGNLIAGNTIETKYYVNGIRLNAAQVNTLLNNYIGDSTASLVPNAYYFTTLAKQNLVVGPGYFDGAYTDASAPSYQNSILSAISTQPSILSQPLTCLAGLSVTQAVTGLNFGSTAATDINLGGAGGLRIYAATTYNLTQSGAVEVWASGTTYAGMYLDTGPNNIYFRQGSGLAVAMTVPSSGAISITPTAAATVGLVINNAQASPTGDLLELQSGGSNVAKVDINGQLTVLGLSHVFGPGSGVVSVDINGGTSSSRQLRFLTNGVLRWIVRANAFPESGGNTGSNFEIVSRDDSGNALYTALSAIRASGAVTIGPVLSSATALTVSGNSAGTVTTITYSSSMTPNAAAGGFQRITVTNNNAITLNAPTNPASGMELTLDIYNNSGVAMGTITWNAAYKLAGGTSTWNNPAPGGRRTITFYYDGTNWIELSRVTADI